MKAFPHYPLLTFAGGLANVAVFYVWFQEQALRHLARGQLIMGGALSAGMAHQLTFGNVAALVWTGPGARGDPCMT